MSPSFARINMILKLLLTFLLSLSLHAQDLFPGESLSSPRETMTYFLKTMKAYKTGQAGAIDLAAKTFDLSHIDQAVRKDIGRLSARRLINTLDRLEYIHVENIPNIKTGEKWIYRQQEVVLDDQSKMAEISITFDKELKKWKFSKTTVDTIDLYSKFLENKKVVDGVTELRDFKTRFKEKMPTWMGEKSFILLNGQWLGIFIIILLGLIFERIIRIYIGGLAVKILLSKAVNLDEKAKKKLTRPMGVVIFAGAWTLGVRVLELQDSLLSILLRFGYIVLTVGCVVTAHHIVDVVALYFQEVARKSANKFDDILVPLLRKTAKTFVIAIGVVAIGNSLTLDMKSILTGLGIGGFAFALAAKDTIGNLFGSLTVLLDRPFRIGDWILIDGKIEGMVEEVGLRSTRIRTFYDSLITVPNGQLTNVHIDNYGQRTYRRFSTKLGLQYDTPPEKIEAFCEAVRQIILAHKWTRKDYFHVYFNGMGSSSLEILVYVFWKVPDWSKELSEKHRLLMDILRVGKEIGVQFAFPTQTLHVFNEEKYTYDSLEAEQTHKVAQEKAEAIIANQLVMSEHRSGKDSGISKKDHFSL
ncbi:MAG: mechanosensitive ion channel family protein [Deltaproteobacteria bacterium]|nr:MAG: mechanosensitive ion channel family protein [Deltaproteobacteria bacterium]